MNKTSAPFFSGEYTRDYQRALIASLVSKENLIAIGKPGCGKTDIAASAASLHGGRTVIIRIDDTTMPEQVKGSPDLQKALSGVIEYVYTDTAFDPTAKVVILDEMFRAPYHVYGSLLHATDRRAVTAKSPVFWATSNFAPKTERLEALRDRFALWVHVKGGANGVSDILDAMLSSTNTSLNVPLDMPTVEECEKVFSLTPGPKARQAVKDVIVALVNACEQEKANKAKILFDVNNRRLRQWTNLLFRASAFYCGTDDFSACHKDALAVMKWAMPTTEAVESAAWQEVSKAAADPIASALSAMSEGAYRALAQVKEKGAAQGKNKASIMIELGTAFAGLVQEIYSRFGDEDPRVKEAIESLTAYQADLVSGRK